MRRCNHANYRMPTVPVYNHEGQRTGEMELSAEVFGVAPKSAVLHQVTTAHAANARPNIAHTKTRGEIRGGGKKPWAQKHTGRARHGSTRSPIWVGGGRAFGPRAERNYAQKVNSRVRRLALRMALSDKVAGNRMVVLEDFAPDGVKTKMAARVLTNVIATVAGGRRSPSALVALPDDRRAVERSMRNLPRVDRMAVDHLNAFDVIRHDVLVTTRAGILRAATQFAPRRSPARAPTA